MSTLSKHDTVMQAESLLDSRAKSIKYGRKCKQ